MLFDTGFKPWIHFEQVIGPLLKGLVNVLKTMKVVIVELLFGRVFIADTDVWFLSELCLNVDTFTQDFKPWLVM